MAAELAKGREFYRSGLIVEAYIDPSMTRTFMILEAPDVETAKRQFDAYPHVKAGLIEFEFTPVSGMTAVAQVHTEDGAPLPPWWPAV